MNEWDDKTKRADVGRMFLPNSEKLSFYLNTVLKVEEIFFNDDEF